MKRKDGLIPIVLEEDPTDAVVTGYAGALPYLDMWTRLGMPAVVDKQVHICGVQGWLDRQMVLSTVLLNLLGGDCVTDIDRLEEDAGLCRMVRSAEFELMPLAARRQVSRRFRAGRTRTFPAATQLSTYLEACHNAEEEGQRGQGKAFVPKPNDHLSSLYQLNTALLARLQKARPVTTATLDADATLIATQSQSALFCYKGNRAYQPYNVWWAEQQVVVHSEFRDGNVPAGWNILPVLKEALSRLPEGVEQVFMRQDTAAYQTDVLAWCEREREHPKYGRILFTISVDITQEFKAEVLKVKEKEWTEEWRVSGTRRVKTGREWAEIVFVPNSQAMLTDIPAPFRYIAIREQMSDQLSLSDVGEASNAPFPTIVMDGISYKLHAIVTNRRTEPAEDLIHWHYERCGKSEEAHSQMKSDFAGGQMPSAKFGANSAWWALMILSLNFQSLIKRLVLGEAFQSKRMKAIRFVLIHTPGRIVHHSRQYCLRVSRRMHDWLASLREAVAQIGVAWAN